MGAERRRSPRFAVSVPVGLRFPRGRFKEGWGRMINISAEGLMFETRFPMQVGGIVYASFTLHDGANFENLRARAVRVVNDEGYNLVGISFDEVVDHQTLRSVLAALAHEGGLHAV